MKVLVVGATGFVGRNLIIHLLKEGHEVVALCRSDRKVKNHNEGITWIEGDLLYKETLPKLEKIDKAFYLVHALAGKDEDFEFEEGLAAVNFINWVRSTKAQIVYLGALGKDSRCSSPHLRSRHLTGAILGASGLGVLEFRASIILGSGSLSFEMIKGIATRTPFIPEMSLLSSPCEALGLDDLMKYLMASLDIKVKHHEIVEIGSKERVSYGELLKLYLEVNDIHKDSKKVPELDSGIVRRVLDYLLPELSGEGKKLVESLHYPTVADSKKAEELFPNIHPASIKEAMKIASEDSLTVYSNLWDKEFIKELVSDKVVKQGLKTIMDIRDFIGKRI